MGFDTVYLTKEQVQRLAAVTLDSLVGAQIHTDAGDDSVVLVDTVTIDDPHGETRHYRIEPDGSIVETT